jgi:hypothetical protein
MIADHTEHMETLLGLKKKLYNFCCKNQEVGIRKVKRILWQSLQDFFCRRSRKEV